MVGFGELMFFGAQKFGAPLAPATQLESAAQSASEWHPGQQPMVVQICPPEQSALVVHAVGVLLPPPTGGIALAFSRVQPAPANTKMALAHRAPTKWMTFWRDIVLLRGGSVPRFYKPRAAFRAALRIVVYRRETRSAPIAPWAARERRFTGPSVNGYCRPS
jgi:hypothetical protein